MLPTYLYRGDSDSHNIRGLRRVFPGSVYGYLRTNLGAGGDGMAIFTAPFPDTINRHVATGWDKTHYLSLSSDIEVARGFAMGRQTIALRPSQTGEWDTSLITLDTRSFTVRAIGCGLYHCSYPSRPASSLPFPQGLLRSWDKSRRRKGNVLLIDVASYLIASAPDKQKAIANSIRDKEWLILPIDPISDGLGQLASVIDDGCISAFECFSFVR